MTMIRAMMRAERDRALRAIRREAMDARDMRTGPPDTSWQPHNISSEQITQWFQFRQVTDSQHARGAQVVEAGRALALAILQRVGESADRTVALREVRLAVMWALAAIADEPQDPGGR